MTDTITALRQAMDAGVSAEQAFLEKWNQAQPELEAIATYHAKLTAKATTAGLLARFAAQYPGAALWLRRAGMVALGGAGAGAIDNSGTVVDLVSTIGGLLAKILPGI